MKDDYIIDVIKLYLKNEEDKNRLSLDLTKNEENVVVAFYLGKKDDDKTIYEITVEEMNKYLGNLLNLFKENLMIIDEKYNLDSQKKECCYKITFNNGRIITLNNFSIVEINNIRNYLYNISINQNEIRVKDEENFPKMNYHVPKLQMTGFVSFSTIFFMTIFFADIFVLSLWIFKALILN